MIDPITIRLATIKDIPYILELYDELTITTSNIESTKTPSLEDYQKTFNTINSIPGYEILVAEDEQGILGSVVLLIMPNLAHRATPWALVENLIVNPKQQRRNIGKKLMEYAIKQARDRGCYKLILNSNKIRKGAHKFYRSLGFESSSYGFSIYF
jgi:L-amino acid N-acyltransferase YncA